MVFSTVLFMKKGFLFQDEMEGWVLGQQIWSQMVECGWLASKNVWASNK